MKPFEMNGDVAIDFNDLLIHSCQEWQVGAYLRFFYPVVLKVSVIKSKPEIFHRRSSVSHAVKIEGFLLYCQGLFFIVKSKFRSSVWFIAVSKQPFQKSYLRETWPAEKLYAMEDFKRDESLLQVRLHVLAEH